MDGFTPRSCSRSRRKRQIDAPHQEGTPARLSYYYTDAQLGATSRCNGTASTIQCDPPSHFVDRRTKNHINGIEGFWSYAKHILYNYRGVSKYHFPMYLKEIEYRFNHRKEESLQEFCSSLL